jgi:hypothetical protein
VAKWRMRVGGERGADRIEWGKTWPREADECDGDMELTLKGEKKLLLLLLPPPPPPPPPRAG